MALYENKIALKGFLGKDAENFATKQQTDIYGPLARHPVQLQGQADQPVGESH